MKSLKLLAAMLLLGSATACSQNVAEKYWQEKVVQRLYGQEYVNLRMVVDVYSICNGKEFAIRAADTIDLHLTPHGLYVKDSYRSMLKTEDSIFAYHFQDGYCTYGQTTNPKSRLEEAINGQLLALNHWYFLEELVPFYLKPKEKKNFKVREFTFMDSIGNSVVLQYSTRKPWKDKFIDGVPYENKENIAVWVDDAMGGITRIRKTIHMTSEGIPPADKIVDIRISDISFGKVDIDEGLYRKHPSKDTSIAFYNMNKEECGPSDGIEKSLYNEVDFDGFLDAPLVDASLDTATLRGIEGWVLVDITLYRCAPCIVFLNQMEKEQQELGYRKLEHEGIKVVCLYPTKDVDMEAFKAYVEQYKISDIAYSAEAINGLITWPGYPYYILLSPDKQVVFRGGDLGKDYKKILKTRKKATQQ